MKSLTFTLLLVGLSFAGPMAMAQSTPAAASDSAATPANTAAPAKSGSDKLDIKKLEQKYWSAKDDDFAVVQNRRYTKAHRFFLTGALGVPFNDAYSTGTLYDLDFGYYFNERWGMDLDYKGGSLTNNDATSQFISRYGVYPDHNVFKSSEFASVDFVPFYAKMSFMDRSIIYFDMGLQLGLGDLSYTIKKVDGDQTNSTPAVKFSVFQQIFFSEHFALRADLSNTWANEDKQKYYIPGTVAPDGTAVPAGDRDEGEHVINDTSLMFGLTYWF